MTERASTLEHWESYWRGHRDTEDRYSTGGRLSREIRRDGPVAGRRMLEVGAGTGRDSIELAHAGAVAVVLDYSPVSLALAGKRAAEAGAAIHLVRANGLQLPFRDDAFDVVFHQGLLEHFRDPRPLLVENARVVARGGRLVVDVPQTFHLYTVMKHVLMLFNAWFAGWETQFTPAQLEGVVSRSGLRIRRTYGEWMVPGLWYRVLREALRRLGVRLPIEPRGPAWWEAAWQTSRAWLRDRRAALYTCHVIGTVAEKS